MLVIYLKEAAWATFTKTVKIIVTLLLKSVLNICSCLFFIVVQYFTYTCTPERVY